MKKRVKHLFSSFIIITITQFCVLAGEDVNSIYQQGWDLENQERFSDALIFYNRVIVEFPNETFNGRHRIRTYDPYHM
ncbi:MAG: hypothetical protein A2Y10_17570 [Planctomycetes bacterium GWF2_41_51]|nr:MAG: hypothetical protein A2Y10_17570 [Planctomycetes bacterium GWF2_41_51]HBG28036.1 hypothetical protein [Phycisphaerales bacterium]